MIDHIPDDWGNWFAGLIDGEGTFGLVYGVRPKFFPQPQFSVGFRDDNGQGLEDIQEMLGGIGTLYRSKKRYTNKHGYVSNPKWDYMVNTRHDTSVIVELFQKFPLRLKKAAEFEIWAKAVNLRNSGEWRGRWTDEKQIVADQMVGYAKQLKFLKQYKPRD